MGFTLSISIALLFVAIVIYLYTKTSKFKKFLFSCGVFISILFYIFCFIADYFTGEGVDNSVIYFLFFGLSGAAFSEYKTLIAVSLLFLLLGIGFSAWLFIRKDTPKINYKINYIYLVFIFLLLSLILNPVAASLGDFALKKIQKTNLDDERDFYKFYKSPKITQINSTKNLVFIYAESIERTYFNDSLFPNLAPNLEKIESGSISFTNLAQDRYSHYTIGGIVESQCGFPLITPSPANSMSGMDTYLENSVCLGDLLHKEGYYLTYMGGADLDFAGKGKFFGTHKFDEVYGKNELLSNLTNNSYLKGWGLYDDSLLDLSYNHFIELSKTKNKFAIFLLTLDTHHPKGRPSESCDKIVYQDGSNPMLNSVACSDYLISKFIERLRKSEYSNNTVIVVVSDHLALENTASKLLSRGTRRNLFIINLPDNTEGIQVNRSASTLDIGATLLPFIGYNGSIGFGRDILNRAESDQQIIDMQKNLSRWEPYLSEFWNFPKIDKSIYIDAENETINLDKRSFKIPILIELNDQLETKLKFEFYLSENSSLNFQVLKLNENQSFMLVEKCGKANVLSDKKINSGGYCLLIGKVNQEIRYVKIENNTFLTTKDIRRYSGIQ